MISFPPHLQVSQVININYIHPSESCPSSSSLSYHNVCTRVLMTPSRSIFLPPPWFAIFINPSITALFVLSARLTRWSLPTWFISVSWADRALPRSLFLPHHSLRSAACSRRPSSTRPWRRRPPTTTTPHSRSRSSRSYIRTRPRLRYLPTTTAVSVL